MAAKPHIVKQVFHIYDKKMNAKTTIEGGGGVILIY